MKDYSVECPSCDGTFLVGERLARKRQCPNCHGQARLLDELPPETDEAS